MEQWQVQRSAGRCAGTDKELTPGEEYYAALIETEEGFERKDFSEEYWQQNTPKVFCFWKTRIPTKDKKKKLLVDDSVLVNIFERLENEEDQIKINFRFVLALILMRKRILKYDNTNPRSIFAMGYTCNREAKPAPAADSHRGPALHWRQMRYHRH